jgi:mannosyltransferase
MGGTTAPKSSEARVALLVVALAAATFVGLGAHDLGRSSLWFDEAASASYAHLDWGAFAASLLKSDAYFALYYTMLHLWVSVFGESETALRAFSLLIGVSALFAIAGVARRLAGPWCGAFAAALCALNPLALAVAREARPYPLLILVSALCATAFIDAAREPLRRRWTIFTLLAICAAYVHIFSLLEIAAFALWATLAHRELWRRGLAWSLAATALCTIPLLLVVASYGSGPQAWIDPPGRGALFRLLVTFAGSLGALAVALIVAAGALVYVRRQRFVSDRRAVALIAAWLVVPPVVALVVTLKHPIFDPRYLLEAWTAFVIAIALALAALPRRVAFAALLLFGIAVAPALHSLNANMQEDWRDATAQVVAEGSPQDALALFRTDATAPYEYYRRRFGRTGPRRLFPVQGFPFDTHVRTYIGSVPASAGRMSRLWVILADDATHASPWSRKFLGTIPPRLVLSETTRYTHITVLRYDAAVATTTARAPI